MSKKQIIFLILTIAILGGVGIYLIFYSGNTDKFDSQTKASSIYLSSSTDSDGNTIYYPIYYYEVNGKNYECKSNSGSSVKPNESKNIVYYDSKNPQKCLTQYEEKSSTIGGIICIVAAGIIFLLGTRKPSENNISEPEELDEIDLDKQRKLEENLEKIAEVADKAQLVYKRVIIGIVIIILSILILIDLAIIKQTIVSKDYIETTAIFVDKKTTDEDAVFDEGIYTFTDKNGITQQITISLSKDELAPEHINIKYNEKNPQDFYGEGSTYNLIQIIWFVVKVIIAILLIILFFNKNLLRKIRLSAGHVRV